MNRWETVPTTMVIRDGILMSVNETDVLETDLRPDADGVVAHQKEQVLHAAAEHAAAVIEQLATREDLLTKTAAELKAMAEAQGLTPKPGMTKAQLAGLLLAAGVKIVVPAEAEAASEREVPEPTADQPPPEGSPDAPPDAGTPPAA